MTVRRSRYVTDCAPGDQHGASTIVWPGSARLFERLAAADPDRFKMMVDLGRAREEAGVGLADGNSRPPVEVKHRAGDVFFYGVHSIALSPLPLIFSYKSEKSFVEQCT